MIQAFQTTISPTGRHCAQPAGHLLPTWHRPLLRLILASVLALILSSAPNPVNPGQAFAQLNFAQQDVRGGLSGGTFFTGQSDLFQGEGIRLLSLALKPTGLTESAAEQVGLILQKNLANTGHFSVVGPREMNASFERDNPDLVDCRETACGVEAGKLLGAQRVLVGTIRVTDDLFELRVRLIDPANNLTDYVEEVRFGDDAMDDMLFQLANNLSRNSLLEGKVLSTSVRGVVVSLGKNQGMTIGQNLVLFRNDQPVTNLSGERVDTQRKNVAIIKVLNVNAFSSEAIVLYKAEDPQVGQGVVTYIDATRQITLIENTRRELDVSIRLANRVRPLELAPVMLQDSERRDWQLRLARTKAGEDIWLYTAVLGGAASIYSFYFFEETTLARVRLYGSIGVAGYGLWRWMQVKEEIDGLMVEGRSKGYAGLQLELGHGATAHVAPILVPGYAGIQLALNF